MLTDLLFIGTLLLAGVYAAVLIVCYVKFRMLPAPRAHAEVTQAVCVIVAARNEENNIRNLLQALDAQECSFHFDVIIVDDASGDRTVSIAQSHRPKKYTLQVIANEGAGTKGALSTGIYSTQADVILVTDADCIPDVHWVQRMSGLFTDPQCHFAAGMIRPAACSGGIELALATETVFLQFVSAGLFGLGNPMMCNGANMAFTRKFFLDVGGFSDDFYVSGDDVFLLQKARAYHPACIRWLKDKHAMAETRMADTLEAAIAQRHRWISKTKGYSQTSLSMAGVVFLLIQILLPLAVLATGIRLFHDNPFWAGVGVKIGVELLLLSLAASFFRTTIAIVMLPVSIILYCIISLGAVIRWYSTDVQWKGRTWKEGKVL